MDTFYRILIVLGCAIVGYLCGSIPNGVIFSNLLYKKDVRDYGSHNSGGTNVARTFSKKVGVLVIILDMIKVMIPFIIAIYLFEYNETIVRYMNPSYFGNYGQHKLTVFGEGDYALNQLCYYLVPFCAMIGHAYSIFLKFDGGKIVATYAGTNIVLSYIAIPVGLTLFLVTLKKKKYVSLASIIMCSFFLFYYVAVFLTYLFTFKEHGYEIVNYMMFFSFGAKACIYLPLMIILTWLLLIIKHRGNISRLLDGTERKVDF